MRIMWVTYAPLGKAAMLIENVQGQSGTWIDATLGCVDKASAHFAIACIASHECKVRDDDSGVVYYGVSGIKRRYGFSVDKKEYGHEVEAWKTVFNDYKPDVIMLWGTEFDNGRAVIQAAGDIPKLIYIQGIMGRITRYPLGKIPLSEWSKYLDPISFIKSIHFWHISKQQKSQIESEKNMIEKCDGIITDNTWADSFFLQYIPKKRIYHIPLTVNSVFMNSQYEEKKVETHSIFSIACNNPAKGTVNLIKAIAKIKDKYPDCKVYLPGGISSRKPEWLFGSPYVMLMKNMIRRLGMESNFVFCGALSPEQMREKILNTSVFVMPSCVENHSSSLREAMYLGAACISSDVGSVNEFVRQGYNGLIYRYEEIDVLAQFICLLFEDREYARVLGDNAFNSIREKFPQEIIGDTLLSVYKDVISHEQIQ